MRSQNRRQRFRAPRRTTGRAGFSTVGCNTDEKIVALTFDDGPDPTGTPQVLNVLREHQARATFFLLGRNVDVHPNHARQIAQEGHVIGNHGYSHRRFPSLGRNELVREIVACDEAIFRATGQRTRIARPPFGHQTPARHMVLLRMGYQTIFWSASGEDWKGDPAADLTSRVLAKAGPGGIILLHDGWEPPLDDDISRTEHEHFRDRTPTVQALPLILTELSSRGYRFVTVPDLFTLGRPRRTFSFKGD